MNLDPNLIKIRDANMALIKQNRFGRAIMQGKNYLLYILGEDRMDQLNKELDDFVDHMRDIYKEQKTDQQTTNA